MSNENIQAFRETHEKLVHAIQGLSEEELVWKQAPEKWSVTEVLSHLADHSIVISFRIRDILADTTSSLPAFGQDAWVKGQHANLGNAADILAFFHAILQYNALLLDRLTEEEWGKSALNFKGDQVRILDIVRGFAAHVENHLGQISRIRHAQVAS
ncbi:DinB family protein [Cohnella terricola]|uniref:DinB family protein n=1 Tax=Cohnella terricola TaxID=1289167 RepID=A0A559JWI5_9BACL|nr:DinB family protein [Cohnella terricola]TVY04248.1 DinB family protein [Cohnella terricola]